MKYNIQHILKAIFESYSLEANKAIILNMSKSYKLCFVRPEVDVV